MAEIDFEVTNETYCVTLPPMMGSRGIWVPGYLSEGVMQYALPQFFIQFIVIFLLNKFLHYALLRRIGFTHFASQLWAGILLGPTCLGRISPDIRKVLFPKFYAVKSHSEEILDAETVFAYIFFIFIVAVKMDMGLLFRVGNKCWAIGFCSILAPLLVGLAALGTFLGRSNSNAMELISIGIEQSITAFPVISWLLQDLKLLNTELGRLALSSAVISDILGIVVFVSIFNFNNKDDGVANVVRMVAFSVGVVFVIRPLMRWVARKTPDGQPVKASYLNILVILVFLSGVASNSTGLLVFFGPFILGLAVPEGPPLGSAIVGKIETFFQGILLPIYVTSTVAKVDLNALFHAPGDISSEVIIILLIFAVKMVACLAPPLICKLPFKDSMALAVILNCKGVVELGAYKFLNDTQRLNDKRMALVVVDIILSASLMPLLVRKLYTSTRKYVGYQRRNLLHLKPDADLPLLTCIHRADNITASINLLDMLHPTKDSPLKIHVIHLTKLTGQSTSELIFHKNRDTKSKSDAVIAAFTNYVGAKSGAALNVFTLMSPPKMFPEYVCNLALDKLVSLVVLPFHKRWSKDGVIDQEDENIEQLNNAVLETAPCSVAVVVDRGNLRQVPCRRLEFPLSVGMFFLLGGNDDREAVVLAKRMARDPNVHLTVVHFCVREEEEEEAAGGGVTSWEKMMDQEVLKDVIHANDCENIRYVKEFVEDGPQTALLVRSMAEKFDVAVVGRNYGRESSLTSGLSEWAEVPELGVLGDILASPDFTSRTTTIVIQQQKLNHK